MDRSVLPAIPFASPVALLAITLRSGGVDWRRLHVFGAMFLRYTALDPLRVAERLVFDRAIDGHSEVSDPIFVVGHWRSGTTFLQELLAADPRFATTTLFDTLLADVSTLTRPWLKPALDRTAQALRFPHNLLRRPLSFDRMGEHDVGLCCQLSPYAYTWGHLLPRTFEDWLDRCVIDPTPEHTRAWLAHLDRYVRKLSWASGGKRLVLKSPGDTGRIAALARHWPGAKFVFLHRDPIAVFHSTRYLWGVIRREFAVQAISDDEMDRLIVATYRKVLGNYLAQRAELGDRLIEVGFADLQADPRAVLGRIYDAHDLGPLPDAVARAAGGPRAVTPQTWTTPPELEQRLREDWDFGFREWSTA